MTDITFRDELRQAEITLERKPDSGEVIALHIVFDEPRPLTDFIRYDILLHSMVGPPIPPPPGAVAARRPCGGGGRDAG